jgi:hypothetical protein
MKERAARMVLALRAETGQKHGSVKRVAYQLDIGVESLRSWSTSTRLTTASDRARRRLTPSASHECPRIASGNPELPRPSSPDR